MKPEELIQSELISAKDECAHRDLIADALDQEVHERPGRLRDVRRPGAQKAIACAHWAKHSNMYLKLAVHFWSEARRSQEAGVPSHKNLFARMANLQ